MGDRNSTAIPEHVKRGDGGISGKLGEVLIVLLGPRDKPMLHDQGGFIPTEEEFWSFVDRMARSYQEVSEEAIREHNRAIYRKKLHYDV